MVFAWLLFRDGTGNCEKGYFKVLRLNWTSTNDGGLEKVIHSLCITGASRGQFPTKDSVIIYAEKRKKKLFKKGAVPSLFKWT